MFREMRRSKQQLSDEEVEAILHEGKTGTLAVNGEGGYPYAVPMNYVYADGRIYLHSARSGHKVDAMLADNRVSFCVVGADDVVPEKYATNYKSVIVFGRARFVEDEAEKMMSLRRLGDKYNPGEDEALDKEISSGYSRVCMIAIDIEHMTGKQGLYLMRNARANDDSV